MVSGDLVRYTARKNKNKACALMRVLDDKILILNFFEFFFIRGIIEGR